MAGGGDETNERACCGSPFDLHPLKMDVRKPVYAITELRPVVEGHPAASDWAQHQHDAIVIDNGASPSLPRAAALEADLCAQARPLFAPAGPLNPLLASSSTTWEPSTATARRTEQSRSRGARPMSMPPQGQASRVRSRGIPCATLTRWCGCVSAGGWGAGADAAGAVRRRTCSTTSSTSSESQRIVLPTRSS